VTERDGFTVKISANTIMDKLESMHDTQKEMLAHQKITNGRVAQLESKSIGMWIRNHPFKFAIFTALFFSIVISDIRHPAFELIISIITSLL
jgi:hypothetical protein